MAVAYLLVGDIGGTNSRFQLFDTSECTNAHQLASHEPIVEAEYLNGDFPSPLHVLRKFIEKCGRDRQPRYGCLAVAGPVQSNRVEMTNRGWVVDGDKIAQELGMQEMRVVNDFVSNGYGLLTLDEETECVVLQDGEAVEGGPKACIGAGTGLGECYLTATGPFEHDYTAWPTEGGHAEFAPRNELEVELLTFLKEATGSHTRVSIERIVSGVGLYNMYQFMRARFPAELDTALDGEIEASGDMKGAVIATAKGKNKLCERVMDVFTTAYGSECGTAALKYLPTGGVYIAGGMAPKNMDVMQSAAFIDAFRDKGRVSPAIASIPVKVVMADDLGQRGALYVARELALGHADAFSDYSAAPDSYTAEARARASAAEQDAQGTPPPLFWTVLGALVGAAATGFIFAKSSSK